MIFHVSMNDDLETLFVALALLIVPIEGYGGGDCQREGGVRKGQLLTQDTEEIRKKAHQVANSCIRSGG